MVSEPTRVLFPFVGNSVGGSHISAITLAQNLPKRFIPVIGVFREGVLTTFLRNQNIDFEFLPSSPVESQSLFRELTQVCVRSFTWVKWIRAKKISVIHTHDMRMHHSFVIPAALAGCQMIWHQRTITSSRRTALLARFSDTVLVPSNYCAQNIKRGLGCDAHAIYNPIEVPEVVDRASARKKLLSELSIARPARIVLFCANIIPQKRPEFFIALAAQMKAQYPDVIFVLVGAAPEDTAQALREHIRRSGVERSCFWIGSRIPAWDVIAASDVFVAPAVREAFGRTLVEAMSLGVPVVAAAEGGHCEIIQHGIDGFLFEPNSVMQAGEFVSNILEDASLADAIRAQARKNAAARFSVKQHVDAVLAYYEG